MFINILSWIAIIAGTAFPFYYIRLMKNRYAFFLAFVPCVVISLAFVTLGVSYNNWILMNDSIEILVFSISVIGITLSSLYFIYEGCKQGIIYSLSTNDWDKLGKKPAVFVRLLLVASYLLFSSFVFSYLYSIWSLFSESNVILGLGDAFYYAISIVYSLPLTGIFEQFQHHVNSNLILRFIEVLHVITTRIIEFIVIGLILNQVDNLLTSKNTQQNGTSYRTTKLQNTNKRRKIGRLP